MDSGKTDEPQILDVDVELTLADTLRAGYQVFAKRARWASAIYCGLAIAAIIFLAVTSLRGPESGRGGGLVVAGVAAAVLLPALALGLIYWNARSGFEGGNAGSHPMHFHFCPDGVGVRSESTGGWFGWESLDGVLETPAGFLLFSSPREYFLIPKRCLDGSEQVGLLRNILDSHLPKSDRPKTA